MLQENICRTRSALFGLESHTPVRDQNNNSVHGARSGNSNGFKAHGHVNEINTGFLIQENQSGSAVPQPQHEQCKAGYPAYCLEDRSSEVHISDVAVDLRADPSGNTAVYSRSTPRYTDQPLTKRSRTGYESAAECLTSPVLPLDLTKKSCDYQPFGPARFVGEKQNMNLLEKGCDSQTSARLQSKVTVSRHAEIQCGTPYVFSAEGQKQGDKLRQSRIEFNDSGSQTEFQKTPRTKCKNTKKRGDTCDKLNGRKSEVEDTSMTVPEVQSGRRLIKLPTVNSVVRERGTIRGKNSEDDTAGNENVSGVQQKFEPVHSKLMKDQTGDSFDADPESVEVVDRNGNMRPESFEHQKGNVNRLTESSTLPRDSLHLENNQVFAKPVALPPKCKVRVAPKVSSKGNVTVASLSSTLQNEPDLNNNSEKDDELECSLKSAFDLSLVRKIKATPPKPDHKALGQPSQVIRSQNNVRRVDKLVERRPRNEADQWTVHPCSPQNQHPVIPPRPAFSDCGTRRLVLHNQSAESLRSHGQKRRLSLDDSGIHSPPAMLTSSPKEQGSPVDSKLLLCFVVFETGRYNINLDYHVTFTVMPDVFTGAIVVHKFINLVFYRKKTMRGIQENFGIIT